MKSPEVATTMFFQRVTAVFLELVIILSLVAAQGQEDDCSPLAEDVSENIFEAVCSYSAHASSSSSFKNETRSRHGVYDGTDYSLTYAIVEYYLPYLKPARCRTSCEGASRENVTWCVRITDPSRYIETCVHLDENQELVFESTCEAQYLNLQEHLSLPTDEECVSLTNAPGCLGLTNIEWVFKDAYLTCITETESCRDVTFSAIIARPNSDRPPSFVDLTQSPLMVEPHSTVVIRAEVISYRGDVFPTWNHGNINYTDHIAEDPFCTPEIEGECGSDSHPNANKQRMNRIRSYSFTRDVSQNCVGQKVSSLETYLVVENATVSDAGTYTVTYIAGSFVESRTVNVSIECDETDFFKARCSNQTISMNEGNSSSWNCQIFAPHDTQFTVVLNQSDLLAPSNLSRKEKLNDICASKEPSASYLVVEEKLHSCYSKYTVHVFVCSVKMNLVGNYTIKLFEGNITEGSGVNVRITPKSALSVSSPGGDTISPATYAVIPIGVLVCALLGIIVAMVVLIRKRKRNRQRGQLSQIQSPDPLASPEVAFYKKNGQFSPVAVLSPQSTCAAFSDPLEFPRNQLYVYTKKILGEGSFGRVLQAKADGIVPGMPERNIVAIKTTKENATSVEIEELLAELDLMRNMKPHENILNLLGQCTTPGGPVCVIVEYARYGNLRDFLRQCEEVVLSLNHKPLIPRHRSRTGTFSTSSVGSTQPLLMRQDSSVFTPGSAPHQFVFPFPSPPHNMSTGSTSSTTESKTTAHHPGTAVPLAHSVAPIGHDYINSKGLVYMEDVQNFALQIACGLQHLSSMEIVHCDLAARNILIAEGFVLKIADFGLARDISGREMYKKNPRGKIPVKWTAPEALENRIFTTKSDVWSFGVVLWELFTYGHSPYPDVQIGQSYETIISYLKEGNRMSQPESCSDEFYKMMMKCWALDPEERPTPVDLVGFLTPLDNHCIIEEELHMNEDTTDAKVNGKIW